MKPDHIALITTDSDPSFHQQKCIDIARSIGVDPGIITVYSFARHPNGPDQGCFDSHHQVWNDIVAMEKKLTLIMEDDVVFIKKTPFDFYASFLNKSDEWDVFYLGHRPIIWDTRLVKKTSTPGIVEVRTNDTHAYLIPLKTAQKLAALDWEFKPVDIFLREHTTTSYAIFPMRAIQCGKIFTPSFFNGMSERNSQYIRYAIQKPLNPFRALFYLSFVIVGQPWIFFSSMWFSLTRRHPK
jgi:GR25 family glycosyltransferase involved in LPS biosynthesis